ncbi:hypothetical protein R3P38DRAFT_906580 [Favolaschia claudopus]|uniref:F-box domain-containing protein n=1 Tax=Favolaschia claudopus TaxID=2862362 RepID=A0AAV9Z000_9AGAR
MTLQTSSNRALSIPELCDLVCGFVYHPDSLPDLKSLALVNRSFVSPAQTHLFHTIDFRRSPLRITPWVLKNALISFPYLRPLIHSLSASLETPDIPKFLHHLDLPGLRKLDLYYGAGALDRSNMIAIRHLLGTPSLEEFSLTTALIHKNDLDILFGDCARNLHALTLCVDMWDGYDFAPAIDEDEDWVDPVQYRRRPQIQTLILKCAKPRDSLENWLSQNNCPLDLRTLRIATIETVFNSNEPKEFLNKAHSTLEILEIDAKDFLNGPITAQFTHLRQLLLNGGALSHYIRILSCLPQSLDRLEVLGLHWAWSRDEPDPRMLRNIDNIVASLSLPALTLVIIPIPWKESSIPTFHIGLRLMQLKEHNLTEDERRRVSDLFPQMSARGVLQVR